MVPSLQCHFLWRSDVSLKDTRRVFFFFPQMDSFLLVPPFSSLTAPSSRHDRWVFVRWLWNSLKVFRLPEVTRVRAELVHRRSSLQRSNFKDHQTSVFAVTVWLSRRKVRSHQVVFALRHQVNSWVKNALQGWAALTQCTLQLRDLFCWNSCSKICAFSFSFSLSFCAQ